MMSERQLPGGDIRMPDGGSGSFGNRQLATADGRTSSHLRHWGSLRIVANLTVAA